MDKRVGLIVGGERDREWPPVRGRRRCFGWLRPGWILQGGRKHCELAQVQYYLKFNKSISSLTGPTQEKFNLGKNHFLMLMVGPVAAAGPTNFTWNSLTSQGGQTSIDHNLNRSTLNRPHQSQSSHMQLSWLLVSLVTLLALHVL